MVFVRNKLHYIWIEFLKTEFSDILLALKINQVLYGIGYYSVHEI